MKNEYEIYGEDIDMLVKMSDAILFAKDLFRRRMITRFFIVGSFGEGTQKEDSDIDVVLIPSRGYKTTGYKQPLDVYLRSLCALDGAFGLSHEELIKMEAGRPCLYDDKFPGQWFYLPDVDIHGTICMDAEELTNTYIEIMKDGEMVKKPQI